MCVVFWYLYIFVLIAAISLYGHSSNKNLPKIQGSGRSLPRSCTSRMDKTSVITNIKEYPSEIKTFGIYLF
jgi:hypothetical protein